MGIGITKLTKFWLHVEAIYRCTRFYALEKRHVWEGMYATADDLIKQKEAEGIKDTKGEESKHKPQIFIDQLLKKRDVLTNEEIVHEVNTIIITVSIPVSRLCKKIFQVFNRDLRPSATQCL